METPQTRKLIAFGWYGGKFSHLDWLLPLLPEATHFCEPFGGSAAVLINRKPSPVETYNDLDGEVTNFFRVLREQPDEMVRQIGLTPFSREELRIASEKKAGLTELERARRFYVCARYMRTGLAQVPSEGRWAHCVLTSRAGMAGAVSRWLGAVEDLPLIAQRLLRVQIENRPALEVIERYDSPETLFYLDPPYVHDTRGDANAYAFEMNDKQHRELALLLHRIKGKAVLSGYDGDLYDGLFADWHKVSASAKMIHSVKQMRTEVVWLNFEPPAIPVPVAKRTKVATRNDEATAA
jgi:DNA adenine methylase